MTYRVVLLRRAANDVDRIAAWIAERSVPGAASWIIAYEAAVQRLVENPTGYALADDLDLSIDLKVRQFLFKTRRGSTYRGVFVVVDDEVRVLRICGPGEPPLTADEVGLSKNS
ncbi:MAG: type II toxin-antitoxin system RelE/ParE family toxin [Planctomycetaceae bacterium]|nr:type II toxin-antitoxin system RelE/ParE family toxin [Planctomycetaceae bacterium]